MEFSVSKVGAVETNSVPRRECVGAQTTSPILSNMLVEAKGRPNSSSRPPIWNSASESCDAKVKKEGAGTIPRRRCCEGCACLPEGEIKFKLLENLAVEIVSDRKKYKIAEWPPKRISRVAAMPAHHA